MVGIESVLLLQKVADQTLLQMLPIRAYGFTNITQMICQALSSLRRIQLLLAASIKMLTDLPAITISTIMTVTPQKTSAEIIFNRSLHKI